jgi:hypothetical protein
MNKYDDFIFVCRDGEKYIYSYNGKEMEFDTPQEAQHFIDGKRGERTDERPTE